MMFVAWCASSDRAADILHARASRLSSVLAEALAGLQPESFRAPRCGCIAWSARPDGIRHALVTRERDRLHFGTHYPIESTGATGVAEANDAVLRDPDRIVRLLPPYVGGTIDGEGLRLFNDYMGRGPLYTHRGAEGTVWSSSPSACALVGAGRAEPCTQGWISYLIHSRFMRNLSQIADVRLEPPATVVTCRRGAVQRRSRQRAIVGGLFEDRQADDGAIVEQVADHLTDTLRAVAGVAKRPLLVHFSGGRDSRQIAAAALAGGLPLELLTTHPPALDLELAGQLRALIGREVIWHREAKDDRLGPEVPDAPAKGDMVALHDRLIAQHLLHGGQSFVSLFPEPARTAEQAPKPTVTGVGGEFSRAFYYQEQDLAAPQDRTRQFFSNMRKLPPMMREHHLGAVREFIDGIEGDSEMLGLSGLHQLDYFFVFQIIRRRLLNRDGERFTWSPYLGHPYVAATAGKTPAWRVQTRLYADVVARLFPKWAPVPFTHELKSRDPLAASNLSHAIRFWATPEARLAVDYARVFVDHQDIIHPDRMEIDPDDIPERWAVAKQDKLINIVQYLSFREYARLISERMAQADRAAA